MWPPWKGRHRRRRSERAKAANPLRRQSSRPGVSRKKEPASRCSRQCTGAQGGGTAAPEPHRVTGASQTAEALEAASTGTSEWTPSGGTGELNVAAQEVWNRLQAQAASLQKYTQEFLATRAVIRVSLLALVVLFS